jgi:hypothetical protein
MAGHETAEGEVAMIVYVATCLVATPLQHSLGSLEGRPVHDGFEFAGEAFEVPRMDADPACVERITEHLLEGLGGKLFAGSCS